MSLVMLLWIDSGRLVAMVSVYPRYHCARTDLVMHVNTPEFTSRIQGDCTNTGVSCFRVFPRPLIDDGDELSTARFLLTWPTESGRVCPPRAVPPDANQNERCSMFCWCFPRTNQTFFQTFHTPMLRGFGDGNWSPKLKSSYPGDLHLSTVNHVQTFVAYPFRAKVTNPRLARWCYTTAATFLNYVTKKLHDDVGR